MIRLDRFLNEILRSGRNEIRRLVRSGAVSVNGREETDPGRKLDPSRDRVEVDGRPAEAPGEVYLMLHKPAGTLCATRDARHPTVIDLLPPEIAAREPHCAGRLDLDATGLVLLTTDGEWSHAVTSPRRHLPKVYEVQLEDPVTADDVAAFTAGIVLRSEARPTAPAGLEPCGADGREAIVTLTEGRYHQIKRMFGARGNRVASIHRRAIGPLVLDPNLAPGGFRELTPEEVESLAPRANPALPTGPRTG